MVFSFGFKQIGYAVIVIAIVFIIVIIIVPNSLDVVKPIKEAITDETLWPEIVPVHFKEFDIPSLIEVKVEPHTVLNELRKKETKSPEVKSKPEGLVYKYFDLTFFYETDSGFARVPDDYLENILVTFKVEKNWLDHNKIKKEDIVLFVWNERHGSWTENKAFFLEEEDNEYIYQSSSRYHGLFAIIGRSR